MKKKGIIVAATCLSIIAVAIILIMLLVKKDSYRLVKVEELLGEVTLDRDGAMKDLFEGMKLIPDDEVATEDDGMVTLLVDFDKHIVAEANTCFAINAVGTEKDGKVTIDLLYGSGLFTIDNALPEDSEFEVETSNAILSVRGTKFRVTYIEETRETILEVLEGVVHVDEKHGEEYDVEAVNTVVIRDEVDSILPGNGDDPAALDEMLATRYAVHNADGKVILEYQIPEDRYELRDAESWIEEDYNGENIACNRTIFQSYNNEFSVIYVESSNFRTAYLDNPWYNSGSAGEIVTDNGNTYELFQVFYYDSGIQGDPNYAWPTTYILAQRRNCAPDEEVQIVIGVEAWRTTNDNFENWELKLPTEWITKYF